MVAIGLAWARRHFSEFSNKPRAILPRVLRGPRKRTVISQIQSMGGRKAHTSATIAGEFYSYYRSLYNLPTSGPPPYGPDGQGAADAYIQASGMPSLTRKQGIAHEGEITEEELALALAQAKPHKVPGPDGFTLPYYETFVARLGWPLLSFFNAIREGVAMPTDSLQCHPMIAPSPSPLLPILGNLELPPGCRSDKVQSLALTGKTRLIDVWPRGDVPSPAEVSSWSTAPLVPLSVNQILHFLLSLRRSGYPPRPLTPFETICKRGDPFRHSLFFMYTLLSHMTEGHHLSFLRHW